MSVKVDPDKQFSQGNTFNILIKDIFEQIINNSNIDHKLNFQQLMSYYMEKLQQNIDGSQAWRTHIDQDKLRLTDTAYIPVF